MKKILLRKFIFLICGVVVLGAMGCASMRQIFASSVVKQSGKEYYLKYNFHYYIRGLDSYLVASIVNYVNCPNHGFMPYNTEVRVGDYLYGFKLMIVKTGETILVDAPRKYTGNKSLDEYLDLILSPNPVSYTNLSKIDRKGIDSGKPMKGMSKKGIMIALGYPAPSFTPDLGSDVWRYWNSRFIKCNIIFKNGKVESISRRDE